MAVATSGLLYQEWDPIHLAAPQYLLAMITTIFTTVKKGLSTQGGKKWVWVGKERPGWVLAKGK